MIIIIILTLLYHRGLCEFFQGNNNGNQTMIQSYEQNFNSSLRLDKEDKILINSWTSEFQLKRINLTTKYRLEMVKHKEHSFKRLDANAEWISCINLHKKKIRKTEKDYYKNESECLSTSTLDDGEMIRKVTQLEKEMEKDNYNNVIQRLFLLKLESMGELFLHFTSSVSDLEECLKDQLSKYLEKVRSVVDTLNKCYELLSKN